MNHNESIRKNFVNISKLIAIIFVIATLILCLTISFFINGQCAPTEDIHDDELDEFIASQDEIVKVVERHDFANDVVKLDRVVSVLYYKESDETVETAEPQDPKDIYIGYVHEICDDDTIPNLTNTIIAMIYTESRFNPNVSNQGCIGLMQVSTYYHADRAEKLGVTDMWDPYGNILIGVDVLKDLYYNYTHEDMTLAIMMYNMNFNSARKLYKSGKLSPYAEMVFATIDILESGGDLNV